MEPPRESIQELKRRKAVRMATVYSLTIAVLLSAGFGIVFVEAIKLPLDRTQTLYLGVALFVVAPILVALLSFISFKLVWYFVMGTER